MEPREYGVASGAKASGLNGGHSIELGRACTCKVNQNPRTVSGWESKGPGFPALSRRRPAIWLRVQAKPNPGSCGIPVAKSQKDRAATLPIEVLSSL